MPIEHVIDWPQIQAMIAVVSSVVGVAVVYLHLFIELKINGAETRIMEKIDNRYVRKP